MTFGQVIEAYLKYTKSSYGKLARFLHVDEHDVINWLDGIYYPRYKQRNQILQKLQFKGKVEDTDGFTYQSNSSTSINTKFETAKSRQKYYESATFDKLKEKVAQRSGNRCEVCGCPGMGQDKRKGLTCHHLVYDKDFGTGNEDLNDLIDICYFHHSLLHSADNSDKAKAYKEFQDGKYKVLLIPHKDGTYNIKLFHDECSDSNIKKYFNQLMRKVKYKPTFEILQLGNTNNSKITINEEAFNKNNSNVDRIRYRSNNRCELCGNNLEVIYNLRTKNTTIEPSTPTYSLLGLCKECANKLHSGQYVETNQSVKLIVFNDRQGHHIEGVPGNIKDSEIEKRVKGNYTIEGPFFLTDIVSESKLRYYLK